MPTHSPSDAFPSSSLIVPRAPLTREAGSTRSRPLVTGVMGTGRLIERDGGLALIEYFDHPGPGGMVRRSEPAATARPAYLPPQTRVHWLTESGWDHGRVVEHDRSERRVVVRASGRRELI